MPDGSVILVEIEAGRLTRVQPSGAKEIVAEPGGGPNGAAMGADGACYVCNNGGFKWAYDEEPGSMRPVGQADDYVTGRIERIDIQTGKVETLYDNCNGNRLSGPNDIVFDRKGNMWFTDLGKARARDLAESGYAALCLDVFGKGVRGSNPEENAKLIQPFLDDRAMLQSRLTLAVDVASQQEVVDASEWPLQPG